MAKEENIQEFVITSGCRFGGKHHDKGERLSLNLDLADHAKLGGELNLSGRIALATPEVMKQIESELAAERRDAERAAKLSASPTALLHPDVMAQIKAEVAAEIRAELAGKKVSRPVVA